MKRTLSILLTAAIVLGLLATGITAAVAAEKTVIDNVKMEIQNFAFGYSTDDISIVLPDGANYTLASVSVVDEANSPITGDLPTGLLELIMVLEPKDGYAFDQTVTGWNVEGEGLFTTGCQIINNDSATFFARANIYDPAAVMDSIEVTLTGMEVGKHTDDLQVSVPEGANYTATLIGVYDASDPNGLVDFSGVIVKSLYRVDIAVRPKAGHAFLDDDAAFTVHADSLVDLSASSRDPANYCLVSELEFRTPIDKAEVTVIGMEEGKSAADVKLTVPEGANYTAQLQQILDLNGAAFTGTFAKSFYAADITLLPAKGYRFTDETDATVGGKKPNYLRTYRNYAKTEHVLDPRTPIDKVEITATELTQGMNAADAKVTVPEGANYTLDKVYIFDETGSTVIGKLEDYRYTYEIRVKAKEGYYLDEDKVTVVFNGREPDYIDDETEMSVLEVEVNYFFGKHITQVELPAFPAAPKAGDTVPAPATTAGKNYQVTGFWADRSGKPVEPGSKFENDRVYMYLCFAQADEGYAFAKDAAVTAGGKAYTDTVFRSDNVLSVFKTYPLGNVKLVDKIVLSGAAPTAGNAPGEVTSSGTGYKLLKALWGVSKTGSLSNSSLAGETFQVGEYVYLAVDIKLEEGYTFDVNSKVLYNGKAYNMETDWTEIDADENYVYTVICLGQLKAASNPDTGDEANVGLMAALVLTSALALICLPLWKKKQ